MNGQFQIGEIKPSRYFLGISVVLGLMFSSITPENESGVFANILQWQIQTVIPMVICIVIHMNLSRLGLIKGLSSWAKLCVSGVIATLVFSPLGLVSDVLLAGEPLGSSFLMECLDEFAGIAPPVTICWVAINAPFQLGYQFTHIGTATIDSSNSNHEDVVLNANFIEMLPEPIRAEILYIKSELHYLSVVTLNGKALILYSLKNAMAELPNDYGMQVHRSFWVNKAHMTAMEKIGREGILTMSDNEQLPVSRRYLKSVSDALNKQ